MRRNARASWCFGGIQFHLERRRGERCGGACFILCSGTASAAAAPSCVWRCTHFNVADAAILVAWLQRAVAEEGAGAAAGFKADVVSQAEMEAAMAASVSKFGRPLDGLVCSAGVFEPTPIAEWNSPYQGKEGTEAEFRHTMDVNIIGTILAVKAALQHWCPVGGSMVIITSTAGQRGSDIYSAYATSKGAQLMFSACIASCRSPFVNAALERYRQHLVLPFASN